MWRLYGDYGKLPTFVVYLMEGSIEVVECDWGLKFAPVYVEGRLLGRYAKKFGDIVEDEKEIQTKQLRRSKVAQVDASLFEFNHLWADREVSGVGIVIEDAVLPNYKEGNRPSKNHPMATFYAATTKRNY